MPAGTAKPIVLMLAAGAGSRLGADKPLLDLGGKPMVERTLAAYREAKRVDDIVLVVPPGRAPAFGLWRGPHVHVIENPTPEKGMISSIRAGLTSVWSQERHFLIAPVDVPFVKSELVDKMVGEFLVRACKIMLPAYRGLGGHPGIFHQSLQNEFFLHGDEAGTREILLRHRQSTVRLHVPDCDVCFDIDTPEDYEMAMDPGARWARVDEEADMKRKSRLGL